MQVGQSFGDMALLDYKPRSATIKWETDCKFAVIPKSDYQKILGRLHKRIIDRLLETIQAIPYFSDWSK